MYNRYIPKGNAYERVVVEDTPSPSVQQNIPAMASTNTEKEPPSQKTDVPHQKSKEERETEMPFSGLASLFGVSGGNIRSFLKKFQFDTLDTGDILLVLILLLLVSEGNDLEMMIALGLLLLMGS